MLTFSTKCSRSYPYNSENGKPNKHNMFQMFRKADERDEGGFWQLSQCWCKATFRHFLFINLHSDKSFCMQHRNLKLSEPEWSWCLFIPDDRLQVVTAIFSLNPVRLILSATDGLVWQSPSEAHSQSKVCMCGFVVTNLKTIKCSYVGRPVTPHCWHLFGIQATIQLTGCGPVQRYKDVSKV